MFGYVFSSNNFALKGKRKTITANDVLNALEDMEFDQFVDPLKECLAGKMRRGARPRNLASWVSDPVRVRHEKSGLCGLRQGQMQTGQYNHRSRLALWIFGIKKMDCSIRER